MPRPLLAIIFIFLPIASFATLPVAVEDGPLPSLAPMLERTTPAVVNISTSTQARMRSQPLLNDPFFRWFFEQPQRRQQREQQSLGSGVIVNAQKGYIITNQHVIEEADEIRVTLNDGRKFIARLLGQDPEMDVAVLQIPAEDLTAVKFADSQNLRVGDFVVAIGSPFGLNQTVTSGIVSALGRSGLGIEGYENFIQTDASINPGNSGGPLVNLRGELVGINTAILAPNGSNVGIGFAIPANMVRSIMRQIVEYGGIERGVFGVTVQDMNAELSQAMGVEGSRGAVIAAVQPGSAAERAGLVAGDVVTHINDQRVANAGDLRTQIGLMRVGERFALEIMRDGQTRMLLAEIADPYAGFVPGEQINAELRGTRLGEVLDQSRLGTNHGIAVGRVTPDSPAWRLGLRDDDVIFQANRRRIAGLDELKTVAARGIWQLKLRRGESLVTLVSR